MSRCSAEALLGSILARMPRSWRPAISSRFWSKGRACASPVPKKSHLRLGYITLDHFSSWPSGAPKAAMASTSRTFIVPSVNRALRNSEHAFRGAIFFVTGGAGFIGSAVIRHLLDDTEAFVVNIDKLTYAASLDLNSASKSHPRYRFHHVDICDGLELRAPVR